ncbi:Hint domain-containing protein [Roseobacteraceae bacterium S113]
MRIDFTEPIENAVIMLTGTNNGGNEYSLVVTSVDDTGFTFRLDEWEDEDGPHPATETINWIAVEPGIHTLPDGRIVEAGTTVATTEDSAVVLNGGFTDPPVVLTNRMSRDEDDVADSDPSAITAGGFNVRLQEGSLSDGISGGETVGYIAISPGGDGSSGTAVTSDNLTTGVGTFDLGADFTNGITLAETQTLNEDDAGNVQLTNDNVGDEARMRFDEETGDGNGAHVSETVGIVTFELGLIPCYTPGTCVTTMRGQVDVAELVAGDQVLTRDNGFQPLRWVCKTHLGRKRLAAEPDLAPVLIRAGALGPGLPQADMWVSPQHRMLVSGWTAELLTGQSEVLVPAKALIDGDKVVQSPTAGVHYMHLLFDGHEVIYANGTPSESLHAAQIDKAEVAPEARAELLRLFPDLDLGWGRTARPCLTVSQGRAFAA